ncbi:hypothetical protein, partial [Paraburkholderia hospita]|uniref:hypothetical protein n=2 Tax=Paraburkholderia hospita TaxID=169430 RepID=UPI001A996E64
RPAQGRRMNGKHRSADASANTSKPNQPRHEGKTRIPAKKPNQPHRECQRNGKNPHHPELTE